MAERARQQFRFISTLYERYSGDAGSGNTLIDRGRLDKKLESQADAAGIDPAKLVALFHLIDKIFESNHECGTHQQVLQFLSSFYEHYAAGAVGSAKHRLEKRRLQRNLRIEAHAAGIPVETLIAMLSSVDEIQASLNPAERAKTTEQK
jgi:hypothetical protein